MSNIDDKVRFIPVEGQEHRTPFLRDYGRVIHSPSFRRLAGKTQLFPIFETDFFRNRLTHSLEVAQIAKAIGIRLQETYSDLPVEPDVCEIAGLLHDIGHPPFGHNGEGALDECMLKFGGFEGNAQTLRIITRLEKKERYPGIDDIDSNGRDCRVGLNLTARVIASVLKYDQMIPTVRKKGSSIKKGYYKSEREIVQKVKSCFFGGHTVRPFRTIECSIMDLADDIAYSTYDIEDAFKGEFLTPHSLLSAKDEEFDQIVKELSSLDIIVSASECRSILFEIFTDVWYEPLLSQREVSTSDTNFDNLTLGNFLSSYTYSSEYAKDGFYRTQLTSRLVNEFIKGIELELNETNPLLSKVKFSKEIQIRVSILKHFAFSSLINSSRWKVAENRGCEIVRKIFHKLSSRSGECFLPYDFHCLYKKMRTELARKRLICDFIAGMTDRYALEFYERLFSEATQTIYKPLY